MNKINNDLTPLTRTPGLDSELDNLQDLLDRLNVEYKAKKDAAGNTVGYNNTGVTTINFYLHSSYTPDNACWN